MRGSVVKVTAIYDSGKTMTVDTRYPEEDLCVMVTVDGSEIYLTCVQATQIIAALQTSVDQYTPNTKDKQ